MSDKTCAVWYTQNGRPKYYLADAEAGAAEFAHLLRDGNTGIVLGVQFADGRAIPASQWAELQALDELRRAEDTVLDIPQADVRAARDPFTGAAVDIPGHEPAWLGVG